MRKAMLAAAACSALAPGAATAGAMSSNNYMLPSKDVALICSPLRYRINCSISLRANPQYSSFCFYVAGNNQSYPMKTDYRFGFYNHIVSFQLRDGVRITGQLTDLRTGRQAFCAESG